MVLWVGIPIAMVAGGFPRGSRIYEAPMSEIASNENAYLRTLAPPRCVLSDESWRYIAGELRLSPRELQIARGLLGGMGEAEIGESRGISEHTVHSHLLRLFRKIGVHSRADLLLRIFSTHIRGLNVVADAGSQPSLHIGGRPSERQTSTNSSSLAVPTHITLSAPPQ